MALKNRWDMISANPVCKWQPSLSLGFLFKNPLRHDEALTESDRGILIGFSRITEIIQSREIVRNVIKKCKASLFFRKLENYVM